MTYFVLLSLFPCHFICSFHPDEKAKRHPLAHMPFGWGPRNCIGMRFALMEAKMALISMLRKFHFEKCPETEVKIKIHRFSEFSQKLYPAILRFLSRQD